MVKKVKHLCVMLPRMSAYRSNFYETKYMSFLIKKNEFIEKHNEICDKVRKIIKKRFDSEPVCNDKYLKAKVKSY